MTTALFVGRFQPFHNGHLWVVKKILGECDKVIIGIGSSQCSNTLVNPFTFDERKEMILSCLKSEGIGEEKYEIIAIPDLNNYGKWVDHVIKTLEDNELSFNKVFTGSPITRKLFKDKNLWVEDLPRKDDTSASEVRLKILKGLEWKQLVPKATEDYLLKIEGIKRISDVVKKGSTEEKEKKCTKLEK